MTPLVSAVAPTVAMFRQWGEPYALIGGLAMIARGRTRLTDDLDFSFVMSPGREQAFLDLARASGFSWTPANEVMFRDGGLLHADSADGVEVDFMTAVESLYEAAVRRATPVEMGDAAVQVATPEDLMLMKLDANRGIDLDDAIALKDIYGASLDRAYLKQAAAGAGLLSRVESLLGPLS